MGILSRLESFLQRVFEAPAGRLGARLQPVSLAKRIERAMDTTKTFGDDGVIVPNVYDLHLHPTDAATFEPGEDTDLDDRVALLYAVPRSIRRSVPLGLAVQKVGAATEHTVGRVQALHVLAVLPYPKPDGSAGDALFADVIGISRFTDAGDSGALVLDEEGAALGQHLGSFDGMSVCMPMARVLDAVGCEIVALR